MHTSYLPTDQRSRLKEVIQMQISSDINPKRRGNNLFVLYKVSESVLFSCFTFLGMNSLFKGFSCSFTHI